MEHIHNELVERLAVADATNKTYYDAGKKFVEEIADGTLVMMKNRMAGVFDPPLVGPFEFVGYKDEDKYACWLKDDQGAIFDCAASHVVPMVEDVQQVRKRKRG